MLYESLTRFYNGMRLRHYRGIFARIREKEGSLSATEVFSADSIYLLGRPTVKQFSGFFGISQPNATYKVGSLVEKGYVTKTVSEEDRRESRLCVSDKFFGYYGDITNFLAGASETLEKNLSEDELAAVEKALGILNDLIKQEDNA